MANLQVSLPLLSVGEIFVGHCIFQHSLFFTGIFQKFIYLFIYLFTHLLLRYVTFNSAVSSSNFIILNDIKKIRNKLIGKDVTMMWPQHSLRLYPIT